MMTFIEEAKKNLKEVNQIRLVPNPICHNAKNLSYSYASRVELFQEQHDGQESNFTSVFLV